MWYFQPKGSKPLVLPEHVQVEEGHYAYEDFDYDSERSLIALDRLTESRIQIRRKTQRAKKMANWKT